MSITASKARLVLELHINKLSESDDARLNTVLPRLEPSMYNPPFS
jgi:hypothetical protein